jgi:hypothetical protein
MRNVLVLVVWLYQFYQQKHAKLYQNTELQVPLKISDLRSMPGVGNSF